MAERAQIACSGLDERHDDGSSEKADPFLVDEGEHLWSVPVDEAGHNSHGEQESRECYIPSDHC